MTRHQRLRRERDPRVRRTLVAAVASAAVCVVAILAVVGIRLEQVRLAYRLDALRTERQRIERSLQHLETEVAALRSPARVEAGARRIGLAPPAPQQVRLAREFVAGGTGLAAARLARVDEARVH